ncbi:HD domain-containing phosphohydrolase [Paenisporosarcina cavernae]|nr:HD domain-containing phosphohydrolase [Paenisporosarcina cavernae]
MDKLAKIFHSIAIISGESDLDVVLVELAQLGKELAQADRCTVWLYDAKTDENWTLVAQEVDEIRVPARSGFIGKAIQSGKTIVIEDAYNDPRFNQEVDRQTGYHTRTILTVPFQNTEGAYFGAFQAINKRPEGTPFTEEDVHLITLAATYAGKAIEAKLLQNELLKTQAEMIEVLGQIGESRSKETSNHVRRVAMYSYELAKLAGIPERESELLRIVSPMHDIGKVATPDAILLKPGKLTPEEFATMKEHASIGYEVFRHSERELLKTAAIIAHQHHERWDGNGYPNQLKGKEIHMFGRITAIADVFDALSSVRVYKTAWPDDDIIAYFTEQGGHQFDPVLTTLFLTNFEKFAIIRKTYAD